jgi:hypothetical protein
MRIQFQAGQRFDLRDDPARFLAAVDFVGERDFAPILQPHSNRMQRISRTVALLHADHGHNRGHVRNLDSARAAKAENSRARKNRAAADADARAAERDVEKAGKYDQIAQPQNNEKENRRVLLVHQKGEAGPHQQNQE